MSGPSSDTGKVHAAVSLIKTVHKIFMSLQKLQDPILKIQVTHKSQFSIRKAVVLKVTNYLINDILRIILQFPITGM